MLKEITLKNGQQANLRRIRAEDYDDVMIFLDKFSRGKGAIWTHQYPNQPKKDREESVRHYESDDELFLGVWKDNELIAEGSIQIKNIRDPWSVKQAGFGLCALDEYTSLGLGTILLKELEEWAVKKKVHRIFGTVRHNNRRALGLYLKAGFQIEGIARETGYFDNQWQHEYYLGKILNAQIDANLSSDK